MTFEFLDRYLLEGSPAKADVIATLLAVPAPPEPARPFLEGLRLLGARTPDLALMALRLALAGKPADDASVVRVRCLVERARRGGSDGDAARAAYLEEIA
jgi:hypothetical protein